MKGIDALKRQRRGLQHADRRPPRERPRAARRLPVPEGGGQRVPPVHPDRRAAGYGPGGFPAEVAQRTIPPVAICPSPAWPATAASAAWSVDPADWGGFLCAIFDEWVRHDVGRVFVQMFDVALESWYRGEASLCIFSETCGRALAVEHNGDLYSCDHYVFPAFRLGNIMDDPGRRPGRLARAAAVRRREARRAPGLLPQVRRAVRLSRRVSQEPLRRRRRTASRASTTSAPATSASSRTSTAAMRFMANELAHERAPANVMEWVRAAGPRAGGCRRRPQRPLPVRQREEVQEVLWNRN